LATGIRGGNAASTTALTAYGTVRMIAEPAHLPGLPSTDGKAPNLTGISGKPISISTGDDGLGEASNFAELGFSVGSFGGRSSSDMDPPRVGRLAFQIGSSARQMVTIDLAAVQPMPGVTLSMALDPVGLTAVRLAEPESVTALPQSPYQSSSKTRHQLHWTLRFGALNHLELRCWRWSPLGLGGIGIGLALVVVLGLQRLRLLLGFGLPQLPA
jgi:hypothetical protein